MESNQEIQHSLAPTPERTPDQKEIARLKGELDACHHSYLAWISTAKSSPKNSDSRYIQSSRQTALPAELPYAM